MPLPVYSLLKLIVVLAKTYLVMSGGFGSSPYVRKRLKSRYEAGLDVGRSNTQDVKVVLVAEP